MIRWLGLAFAAFALGLAACGYVVVQQLQRPGDEAVPLQDFVIEEGETLNSVAHRLARAKLLEGMGWTGARGFAVYARISRLDRDVKSGEYELSGEMSCDG